MNNKATASSLLIAGIGSVGTAIYMMSAQNGSRRNLMSQLKRNRYYKQLRKAYKRAF
ncbi:ABC-type lipoprotein release transport system permease subunit [Geomicrobium halophilum]|uniref:ABC-type lipoprotein release transport system permease subunit n=1 Tax=Geomicrobium halophilum TaxID=549000 RepID=A0A841PYX2_9BACL|nr:hypothetical protein [Geomicrobium halophilum]MBB6449485.1 ABC-type lipoprotein release transport system permease subunit [Geomicrobium halophilum]